MDRRHMLAGLALTAPVILGANGARAAASPGPQEPPPADTEQDEPPPLGAKAVQLFAATLNAHDISAFAALFADNYINHQTSAAAPSPSESGEAKQLTVAYFAARLRGLPDLSVTIEAMVATQDKAAASFVYEGTHNGLYLGYEPTGRRVRFTSCDIFALRDGRIAEHWGMGDIAGVIAQLKG